ncbi:MAG: alcohol dehydrogenase catalytic domain-containing protein [Candidatus Thermoplasmatota archaeon]
MVNMKVAMYYNNNDVRIEEMPVPSIKDDELLVKIHASGICGSDVMEWYRIKKAPRVLGHEIAGEIVEIGRKVKGYKKGDRVFVSHHVPCNSCYYCVNNQHTLCRMLHTTNFHPGGFAQYIQVPGVNIEKKGVLLLPSNMSYQEAVFIEPLACVIRGLHVACVKPGQSMIVVGAGISGLLHVKLANVLKIKRVLAVDVSDYRLTVAKSFGAYAAFKPSEATLNNIKDVNEGELPDIVAICTGAPSAIENALGFVRPGGVVLFFAPPEPGVKIPFSLFDLWNKQVRMVSTYAGSPSDLKEALDIISSKRITVTDMITHKLPLSETAEGFRLVAKADKSIKVIIEPQRL